MDLTATYIANGAGVLMMLLLLYVTRKNAQRKKLEDRLFLWMQICVLVACVAEPLSCFVDEKIFFASIFVSYFLNTLLFMLNAVLSFCLLLYFDFALYGDKTRILKHYKPQIIIAGVLLAACVVNIFLPFIFTIDETNKYSRLPVSYVYFATIFFYAASAWYTTYKCEKERGVRSFLHAPLFLVPVIVGAAIQFAVYGLSIGWLACAIGLVFLYMMRQNERAYIDATSDTYNRQYMKQLITSWSQSRSSIAGLMLDIDRFKSINDTFGHLEGDDAIHSLAEILIKSRVSSEIVFRFAGDEFIVLKKASNINELDQYIENMTSQLDEYNETSGKPYRIEVSYGVSYFESQEDTFGSLLRDMDIKLYDMKTQHHVQTQNVIREAPGSSPRPAKKDKAND